MKKMTQGDIDAGLTQEDVNLGLRGKVTKGDSDAAMRSRMTSEKYDSPSIVDQYRDLKKNPPAKAFPVADRKKIKEMAPEADPIGARKGGTVKMAKGGSVSSASKRADGCAVKGKTRGMMR
jgi:hypothetical protein